MVGPESSSRRALRTVQPCHVEGSQSLRLCHEHGLLPASDFHKSSINRRIYWCKQCVCTRTTRWACAPSASAAPRPRLASYRAERPPAAVCRYFYEHRSGYCAAEVRRREGVYVSATDIEAIAQRYGDACFVTGMKANGQRRAAHEKGLKSCPPPSLTVIRADPALPFSVEDNAVLCTRVTARLLNYTLPPHLLAVWRARKEATPQAEQEQREPAVLQLTTPAAVAKELPAAESAQQQPAALQPTAPAAAAAEELPAAEPERQPQEPAGDQQPCVPAEPAAAGLLINHPGRAARWAELRRGLLTKDKCLDFKRKREEIEAV